MAQRRRIGEALKGFVEGFVPLYQARPLRRFREAQTARLESEQGFLDLMLEMEQARQQGRDPGVLGPSPPRPGPPLADASALQRPLQRRIPPSALSFGGPTQTPGGQALRGVAPFRPQGRPADGRTSASPLNLLGQIQKAGFAQEPPPPPPRYPFVRTGTPEARQAVGDGTDLVPRMAPEVFGGGRDVVDFKADVDRANYDIPQQFDPWTDQMRRIAALAGFPNAETMYPSRETPEWQIFQPFIENYVRGIANMVNAKGTTLSYTNEAGQTATTTANLELFLNAPAIWSARDIPGVGPFLERTGVFAQLGPREALDTRAANNRQIATNASVDEMTEEAMTSPLSPHNPLQRMIRDNPLGPRFETEGPFGRSITTTEIDAGSRRVLENMVPIARVAQQVGELALELNVEETRFLASLKGIGQTVDSWLNTTWFTPPEQQSWSQSVNKLLPKALQYNPGPMSEEDARRRWLEVNPLSTEDQTRKGLDRIRQLSKLRQAYAGIFAEMGGERGRKTEEDVRRALLMVPGAGETKALTQDMLNILFDNMINTYESITKGVVVTLGEWSLTLEGEPVIEGGLMGEISRMNEQIKADQAARWGVAAVEEDVDARDPAAREDGAFGQGDVRPQSR
jgi:hypothetical protein